MPTPLDYFNDLFSDFNKDRQEREKAWNDWSAMFRGVFRDGSGKNVDGVHNAGAFERPTKSRLYVNETKQAIVSAVSNIMSIIFQQAPPFLVTGRSSKPDEETAKLIQQTVWYYLTLSRYPILMRRYLTQDAVFGVTYAKVFTDTIRDVEIDVLPKTGLLNNPAGTVRGEVVREYPVVKWAPKDIFDIWPDPVVSDHTQWGRGLFDRFCRSKGYVEHQMKTGKYRTVDLGKAGKSIDSVGNRDLRRSIVGLSPLKRSDLELFEFWGVLPQDIAEQWGVEFTPAEYEVPVHCVLVGDGGQFVDYFLAERNGLPGQRLPYVRDIWEDTGDGPYGRGIPENVRGPQIALNMTINSRIDNKAAAIQQVLGVNEEDMVDPENDLQFKQNWVMRFRGGGNIRDKIAAFSVPDITQNAYIEAKEFQRMIEEQSGILKYVQGTESYGSNRTAQGIATVYQAANKFLRDLTFQIEQNAVADTCRLMYQHILKYMPDEMLVMITENPNAPEFRRIALQDIAADVDFIPSGVQGLTMKEVAQNQLIQFAQGTANPIDMQIMGLDGRRNLLRRVAEGFGFKNVEEIVPENPVMPTQPNGAVPAPEGPAGIEEILASLGGQTGNPAA